jgi:hypothetical protein
MYAYDAILSLSTREKWTRNMVHILLGEVSHALRNWNNVQDEQEFPAWSTCYLVIFPYTMVDCSSCVNLVHRLSPLWVVLKENLIASSSMYVSDFPSFFFAFVET